ncbi:MAG: nucleotidyltransferase domain-containing protein [Chloroflexota bacterium]|nr:nucleotidyltransferase domain-containing protein [Chloroflexota bacterium]
MIDLVANKRDEIAALCRHYYIQRLDLFGSAATGAFNPETSDLDFVVDLGEYEDGVARRYCAFIDALENLLGRRVDLVTDPQIRNPYFREAVDEQRVNLYEARNRKAVA